MKFMRYFGHFEGDAQSYRAKDEVKQLRETRDCLLRFAAHVTAAGGVDAADLAAIDKDVAAQIDRAVERARSDPKPTAADLLTNVYASYP
jgi:pyruvate dehydrogenase E1 component alpha subunit